MNRKLNCILLIDDDEPTNFINQMALEEANCAENIKICQTAIGALEFLKNESIENNLKPDLILLDINMPGFNGWEFLAEYKNLPSTKQAEIVLVMLTTTLNASDQKKAAAIDVISGFQNKPLNQQIIQDILFKYFPNRH